MTEAEREKDREGRVGGEEREKEGGGGGRSDSDQ